MTSVTDPPPFDRRPMRDRVVQVSGGTEGVGRVIAPAVIAAGGIGPAGIADS